MRLNYGQFPPVPSTAWIALVLQVLRSFEKNPKNYGQNKMKEKLAENVLYCIKSEKNDKKSPILWLKKQLSNTDKRRIKDG
jgi:hypothetical protein